MRHQDDVRRYRALFDWIVEDLWIEGIDQDIIPNDEVDPESQPCPKNCTVASRGPSRMGVPVSMTMAAAG